MTDLYKRKCKEKETIKLVVIKKKQTNQNHSKKIQGICVGIQVGKAMGSIWRVERRK